MMSGSRFDIDTPRLHLHPFTLDDLAALHDYAFARLGMENVRGSTDAGNIASVRVMERLGMELEKRGVVNGLDTLFYMIMRERG